MGSCQTSDAKVQQCSCCLIWWLGLQQTARKLFIIRGKIMLAAIEEEEEADSCLLLAPSASAAAAAGLGPTTACDIDRFWLTEAAAAAAAARQALSPCCCYCCCFSVATPRRRVRHFLFNLVKLPLSSTFQWHTAAAAALFTGRLIGWLVAAHTTAAAAPPPLSLSRISYSGSLSLSLVSFPSQRTAAADYSRSLSLPLLVDYKIVGYWSACRILYYILLWPYLSLLFTFAGEYDVAVHPSG